MQYRLLFLILLFSLAASAIEDEFFAINAGELPEVELGQRRSFEVILYNSTKHDWTIDSVKTESAAITIVKYPERIATEQKAVIEIEYYGSQIVSTKDHLIVVEFSRKNEQKRSIPILLWINTLDVENLKFNSRQYNFGQKSIALISAIATTFINDTRNAYVLDEIIADENFDVNVDAHDGIIHPAMKYCMRITPKLNATCRVYDFVVKFRLRNQEDPQDIRFRFFSMSR